MFKNIICEILNKKKVISYLIFAGIPASLFFVLSFYILRSSGFEAIEILRDPAQQTKTSSFLGFLSNIGVFLWIASLSIACFTSSYLYKKTQIKVLLLIGVLSMILAIDDFFLIHDRYIDQKICFLFYAFAIMGILLFHLKEIIDIAIFPFLLSGFLLASSIVIDLGYNYLCIPYAYAQVLEEFFKFTGGATWLYFTFSIAAMKIGKVNKVN